MAIKIFPSWYHPTRCSTCERLKKNPYSCKYSPVDAKVGSKVCNKQNKYKYHVLTMTPIPPCTHNNLVPYEVCGGQRKKRDYNEKGTQKFEIHYDWASSILSAHRLRVISYFCPGCKEIILAPTQVSDK